MFDRFVKGRDYEFFFFSWEYYGGDFWGIVEKIDYFEEFGVNVFYLMLIFEFMMYYGYDIIDYFRVVERFGGEEVFWEFVKVFKSRDIKFVFDGVFYYISFFYFFFRDVVERGEESEYVDFYCVKGFFVVLEEFIRVFKLDFLLMEKY